MFEEIFVVVEHNCESVKNIDKIRKHFSLCVREEKEKLKNFFTLTQIPCRHKQQTTEEFCTINKKINL